MATMCNGRVLSTSGRAPAAPGSSRRPRRPVVACSASLLPSNRPQHNDDDARSASSRVLGAVAGAFMTFAVCASGGPVSAAPLGELPETAVFGNGCFWGRQFDFIQTEKAIGKEPTAVVGYAGGTRVGPDGKVCYYLGDPQAVYEKLGHAEVVQVTLDSQDPAAKEKEFRQFARTYFKQFRRTDQGLMQRLDPQDVGAGYRNVVGLPGGASSPLFQVLQEENVNKMDLRVGQGNEYRQMEVGGRRVEMPTEGDELNVVWVVDSNKLPFYRAERYHQFHNGIGKMFPTSYTWDLKNRFSSEGKIGPTGCLELPF